LKRIIGVAVAILVLSVNVQAAVITGDGLNTISLSGQFESGDSARFNDALGSLDQKYVRKNGWELWINSTGGDASECITIVYLIDRFNDRNGAFLTTYLAGRAYSAGAILFLMGDDRVMTSLADIMLHEAAYYNKETGKRMTKAEGIAAGIPEHFWNMLERKNAWLLSLIKKKTNLPVAYFFEEMFMNAETALKYGVATRILQLEGGRI
jgi:ATP-dependent protease ClpP protease subunit